MRTNLQISFSPIRSDESMSLEVEGDALIINGETFDFTTLPEGASLPCAEVACRWLVSDVVRSDGQISLTLILPHGANAPHETLFPASITVTSDGLITPPSQEIAVEG